MGNRQADEMAILFEREMIGFAAAEADVSVWPHQTHWTDMLWILIVF